MPLHATSFGLKSIRAICGKNFSPTRKRVRVSQCGKAIPSRNLTKPADALALLESLPDPSPFETVMDTFRAHADPEHLNRLAPERRAVVIELLNRLDSPLEASTIQPPNLAHHE